MKKARNLIITKEFLEFRAERSISAGYSKQKWVEFCEKLLEYNYELSLYEAKETVSKYVTVRKHNKEFLVRFSNHKPNRSRESNGDCDFFVGRTHTGVRTTIDALNAVYNYFDKPSSKI